MGLNAFAMQNITHLNNVAMRPQRVTLSCKHAIVTLWPHTYKTNNKTIKNDNVTHGTDG